MVAKKKAKKLIKLDLGCGPNPREGFVGVDIEDFGKKIYVRDLRKAPWPWQTSSVDEVFSSHFVEHLTGAERVPFFNELWRVMKPGTQAQIIVPNWSHACAYGDPTHQWPPMSEWFAQYLDKEWRAANAPHVKYACDFTSTAGGSWDEQINLRNMEYKLFAMRFYTNAMRDLYVTLTKRAKAG